MNINNKYWGGHRRKGTVGGNLTWCSHYGKPMEVPWKLKMELPSVQFSHTVVSDSLQPHGLQHARLPCPSLSPRVCPSSYPLNWWCHPTFSSSVALFSFCEYAKLLQLYPTLCDPVDCSRPGSSVHGLLQARVLEWVAMLFSRGSSWPGIKPVAPALQADSLLLSHQGSPIDMFTEEHKSGGQKC